MSFASAQNINEKFENDSNDIINNILAHTDREAMISVLRKGPPNQLGFMWGLNIPDYWTPQEIEGINQMHIWVLQHGWESSGYAIMFRELQNKIKNMDNNHIDEIVHSES